MPEPTEAASFTRWVEELARSHTRSLALLAARESLGVDDALDAVQEAFATFLRLPQARGLSEHPDDAFALLAVIVRNAARNIRRRQHRARDRAPLSEVLLVDDGPSVDQLIEMAERHVAVLGCARQLGEVQRHVVNLRMIEEFSAAEVARVLGLTPTHVAVVLHRAKALLRRCLSE